ncbi:MAG TPA: class I SAM-dependent methyltransferase [Stellaceae bacterium]|nr:class I SAM-dependent methyltransferase [Stellaceae bacterium]
MPNEWPSIRAAEPVQYAHTTAVSRTAKNPLTPPLISAFEDAMAGRGRLKDELFWINGFSGKKFRTFLNNLLSDVPDPRYLEIGLFHGASFCPAIYRNALTAVGIDNWSEYGGDPQPFFDNLAKFRGPGAEVEIVEKDFRKIDFTALGRFNVLFYDGSHQPQDQYDGVLLPQPAIERHAILIVDDWNWDHVRANTFNALRDAHATIDYQIEIRTSFANEHLPLLHGAMSEWHNGCLIAAVSKRR